MGSNDGKVIFAGKAEIGKYYTNRSGIIVMVVKRANNGRIILKSTETDNELDVKDTYILKEVPQGEVEKMTKKKKQEKAKEMASDPKKKRKLKALIEFDRLRPYMQSGKPVKAKEIGDKIAPKLDKSIHTPHKRVYASLMSASKKGLVKFLGKGTFQLKK